MKIIKLIVNGQKVIIDYKKDQIHMDKSLSEEASMMIGRYLNAEGFLDDEYINLMKAEH